MRRSMSWYLPILIPLLSLVLHAGSAQCSPSCSDFPIAVTPEREMGFSVAYDGTNYLVGVQGDAIAHYSVGAQLVSGTGALLGPLISTGRTGSVPLVAFDGTRYLLVWTDDANIGSYKFDVFGQFISKAGTLQGAAFLIARAAGRQDIAGVTFNGTDYLVVWTDSRNDLDQDGQCDGTEGTCIDIYARMVHPSGTLLGQPIVISKALENQKEASVASDGESFLVVWDSKQSGDNEQWDIIGRFVTKSGKTSAPFLVSQTPSPSHNPMSVSYDGANYLVVWNKDMGPGYPAETKWDVHGRLVSPSGPVGSEFPVTEAPGSQVFPFVLYDGFNYLVTWTDSAKDANHNSICDSGEGTCMDTYGRFVNIQGTPVGPAFVISKQPGSQFGSAMAFDGSRFLVLSNWGDFSGAGVDTNLYGIFVPGQMVSIKATDPNASEEGEDPGVFTISRVGKTSAPLTIKVVIGGTASNGSDYQTLSKSVVIPAGSSFVKVKVEPIDDNVPAESKETVIVTLAKSCSYVIGSPSRAVVSMADNDQEPVLEQPGGISCGCRSGFQPRQVHRGWKPLLQKPGNPLFSDSLPGI